MKTDKYPFYTTHPDLHGGQNYLWDTKSVVVFSCQTLQRTYLFHKKQLKLFFYLNKIRLKFKIVVNKIVKKEVAFVSRV